jgi:protein-ribulosamine 3-kinase
VTPDAALVAAIARATGAPLAAVTFERVGGGDTCSSFALRGGDRSYFVKLSDAARLPMFEAEAAGLEALARTGCVRVPQSARARPS